MAMVYRASKLAMAAAKAQQPSRAAMAAAKGAAAAPAAAASQNTAKVVSRTGIMATVSVSPAMKKFLGVSESTRTEVVKKIWEHIKANNLQNPANKREILCDNKLKAIFGQKEHVTMFEIAKLISPHIIKK